jgi:hypothetical protein
MRQSLHFVQLGYGLQRKRRMQSLIVNLFIFSLCTSRYRRLGDPATAYLSNPVSFISAIEPRVIARIGETHNSGILVRARGDFQPAHADSRVHQKKSLAHSFVKLQQNINLTNGSIFDSWYGNLHPFVWIRL